MQSVSLTVHLVTKSPAAQEGPTRPDEDRVPNWTVLQIIVDRADFCVCHVQITQAREDRTYEYKCLRDIMEVICLTSSSNSWQIIAGVWEQTLLVPTWRRTKSAFLTKSGCRLSLEVNRSIVTPGNVCTIQSSSNARET